MNRYNWIIVLLLVAIATPGSAQMRPSLLEMLAEFPGQEAVYLSINDSTAVDYQDQVYIYRRFFESQTMVLRQGSEGISTVATPVIERDDKIEITAFTITPESDTIYVLENERTKLDLHGNKSRYVLSFPDARAGAVHVFRWVLESYDPVFSGRRYLGRTYPVIRNHTVISAHADWIFNFLIQPSCRYEYNRLKTYPRAGEMWLSYAWDARAINGLRFEPNSPPVAELIPSLYYAFSHDRRWPEIARSKIDWKLISNNYSRHIDSYSDLDKKIADDVVQLCEDTEDIQEKIKQIVDYLNSGFDAIYSDIDLSGRPEQLLNMGYGSQAEASLLLGSLLEAVDIKFDFYLISTRHNGQVVKKLPALFYFNRLLIAIETDSDPIWIDPFYKGTPIGVLPFEDQGVEALKVGRDVKDFIVTPMSDYRENGHAVHLKISFGQDGEMVAEGVELLSGALNIEEKYSLQNLEEQKRFEKWSNLTSSGIPGSILERVNFSDYYSDNDPYRISYKVSAAEYIRPDDTFLYLPLDILGRWQFKSNFESRRYPVELGRPHSQQERITIDIPEGYRVDYLPENFTLTSYLGEIISVVVVTAKSITITRSFGLKPYRLKPNEAESLNGFLQTAMDQAQKYIVLRK